MSTADLKKSAADSAQTPHPDDDPVLESLVDSWLTLPDVAERLGVDVSAVRRMVKDRLVVGVRRGERHVLSIPAALLTDDGPLLDLPGTLTVLSDSGFDDAAALRWLFTPDDTLPGTPVDAIRAGRKTEVRRRAQALGF